MAGQSLAEFLRHPGAWGFAPSTVRRLQLSVNASFRWRTPEGNRGTIFPIRCGAAFITVELANLADLRHRITAFLIVPLMVAAAGQGLRLLRQCRVIDVHQ